MLAYIVIEHIFECTGTLPVGSLRDYEYRVKSPICKYFHISFPQPLFNYYSFGYKQKFGNCVLSFHHPRDTIRQYTPCLRVYYTVMYLIVGFQHPY